MKHYYRFSRQIIIFLCFIVFSAGKSYSQCTSPRLFDINFTKPSSTPFWENCIDNSSDPDDYILTLISPDNIVNYQLDFGDGSPVVSGALWPANTPVTHQYGLGRYVITLSETKPGCTKKTITGNFTNDRKAGATALPPTIGTSGCVPHTLTFVNKSTNTSPFTKFEWDWGDGIIERVGSSTVDKPISHVYQRGKAGCNMVVKVTAFSLCDTTFSSYGPYDFWDIDTAAVTASATKICKGQNITFRDETLYNCNVKQPRKIRWDFRNVGGPLTGWLPATPENRVQTYFVKGNVGDVFTVSMQDSNFCGVRGAAVSVQIIAPPSPGIGLAKPTICVGQDGEFKNTTTGNADIYYWNFGDGSTVLSTGDKNDVKHTYKTAGIYTVSLIAAVDGTDLCRDTTSVSINVLNSSISDFALDKTSGCNPVTVNITEKSKDAVSWFWTLGDVTTSMSKNPGSVTFSNPGTYQIKLETTNSLGCGNSKTSTVNVYPAVGADSEVDTVCLGNAISFKDKSVVAIGSTCATGNILYEKYDGIPGAEVFRLTSHPSFPNSPTSTALLNLFEAPSNIGDNFGARIRGFICPPQSGNYVFWIASDDYSELYLSTDANPVNKVLISSVSGFTGLRQYNKYTSQQSVPIFLQSGQRYYIEALHKEGVIGDQVSVAWQLPSGVKEQPIPGNRLSPYSEGSTIQSWAWNFGNGKTSTVQHPSLLYTAPGNYNVQLTVSTGKCSSTVSKPVVVYPSTKADFTQSDTAACTPFSVEYINKSTGASKLFWDFGDGSPVESYVAGTKDTLSHVFINNSGANQTYYVRLISETTSGCRDTLVKKVKVFPGPKADFSFVPSIPKCSPIDVVFTNTSATASQYKWYFGSYDSSTTASKTFNHKFVNKATTVRFDTIILHAYSPSGCYGEKQQVITVFPEAFFDIVAVPDSGCNPATVNFSVKGGPVNYLWDFGDGAAGTTSNPSHVFNNSGNSKDSVYKVTFTGATAFGCKDTTTKNIKVFSSPEAEFVASTVSGCSPLTINFQNLSKNESFSVWNFGNGKIDTIAGNFDYTFINTDISVKKYKVTLSVFTKNGCTSTKSVEITVNPEVHAFISGDLTSGCSPVTVGFRNTSTGASSYFWDFGDGSSSLSKEPVHIFTNNLIKDTTYHVKFTATSANGCHDTAGANILVKSVPTASFQPDRVSGCGPLDVNFQNLSLKASSSVWVFGDGSKDSTNSGNVAHNFVNNEVGEKIYTVTLKTYGITGCQAVRTENISVYPLVNADFDQDLTKGCSPLKISFSNQSSGEKTLSWDFGDSGFSSSKNPVHTFVNNIEKDTTYNIKLYATSSYNCKDSATASITVSPMPEADFTADPISACSPLEVDFTDESRKSVVTVWSFDDGEKDSVKVKNVKHKFVNNTTDTKVFNVVQKVYSSGNCIAQKTQLIKVYPAIKAEFIQDNKKGCSPLNVVFTNNSTGAKNYSWNFGNGYSSNGKDPVHSFTNSGLTDTTFKIVLQIVSQNGCRDSAVSDVVISPTPEADFSADFTSGCTPHEVELTDNSKKSVVGVWDFGDGKSDSVIVKKFKYKFVNNGIDPQVFKIHLKVYSIGKCTSEKTVPVTVFPAVKADFSADNLKGCSPLKVVFSNNSAGAKTYNWNFGDGLAASSRDVSHTFLNSGLKDTIFNVLLNLVSANGCRDSAKTSITVSPTPQADFTVDITRGCSPLKIAFTDLSVKSVVTAWSYGDGTKDSVTVKSVSHEYVNNGTDPVNFNLLQKVYAVTGCVSEKTQVFTVYPAIRADYVQDATKGCSPLKVGFINNSTGARTYNWDFGDGLTSGSKDVTHTFTNQGLKDTSYTIVLKVVSANGCTDSLISALTVSPAPQADFSADITKGCSPLEVNFLDFSTKSTSVVWSFGDGIRDSLQPIKQNLKHIFINNGSDLKDLIVNQKVYTLAGCTAEKNQKISIYPAIHADFVLDTNKGCSPLKVTFSNNSSISKSYNWDFGNGLTSSSRDIAHTFTNPASKDTTYNVVLRITSTFGCIDSAKSAVTVLVTPEADFVTDISKGCSPLGINFIDQSNKSVKSVWSFGDGSTDSTTARYFKHTYVNNGSVSEIYSVTQKVRSTSGCTAQKTQPVTVYPVISANFTQDIFKGCSPLKVTFTNNSINARTSNWDFGDGLSAGTRDVLHTFLNSGNNDTTYKILLTVNSANGCIDTVSSFVTVSPLPEADFTTDETSGCSPLKVAFTDLSKKSVVSVWSYGDSSRDSTVLKNAEHIFVNNSGETRIFTVEQKVYSAGHCSAGKRQIITVFSSVNADFAKDIDKGCSPLKVNFVNKSVGGRIYNWNFGDGLSSDSKDPFYVFNNSGTKDTTYRIVLNITSANGCKDSSISNVKVNPSPEASFKTDVLSGCTPLNLTLTDLSSKSVVSVWDFNDGSGDSTSVQSFIHTFVNSGSETKTFTIGLKVYSESGCTATKKQSVIVFPGVKAEFSHIKKNGCSPLSVDFANSTTGAKNFRWEFGDRLSSSLGNPAHIFNNDTKADSAYKVTLYAFSGLGCQDSAISYVTVYPQPVVDFIPDLTSGCSPLKVNFKDFSALSDVSVWSFGDSGRDSVSVDSIVHEFTNNQTITQNIPVQLKVYTSRGCAASRTIPITVFPEVHANIGALVLEGCTPLKVKFVNKTTGASITSWNFGDGGSSSDKEPEHNFVNNTNKDTSYKVKYFATSQPGCKDSSSLNVTVYSEPEARYVADVLKGCTPLTVNFTDLSGNEVLKVWDFGDGNLDTISKETVAYKFFNNGSSPKPFTVALMVGTDKGCKATTTQNIVVNPPVLASFTASQTEGCSPVKVTFENTSAGASKNNWNFGNSFNSSEESPVQVFLNTGKKDTVFNVRLIATSVYSCSDTSDLNVKVFSLPVADFVTDMKSGCSPLDIAFTNLSERADSLAWNFGDGGTTGENLGTLNHQFVNTSFVPADYKTSLTAFTKNGCKSSRQVLITAFPEVSAYFLANDTIGCTPLNVKFTNLSNGGTNYLWSFGDGTQAGLKTVGHKFVNSNINDTIYEVNLHVISDYNCSASYSHKITVHSVPEAGFSVDNNEGCSPLKIALENQSRNSTKFEWDFGTAGISDTNAISFEKIFTHIGSSERINKITLKAYSEAGCIDQAEKVIRIYPEVDAEMATSDTTGCSPNKVNFFNLSGTATNFNWNFGDGDFSPNASPSHTFNNDSHFKDTVYHVEFIASNSYKCADTLTKEVVVYARPDANFVPSDVTGCSPVEIAFKNLTTGGDSLRWDFGDNHISGSMEKDVINKFTNTTGRVINPDVELIATTKNGCSDRFVQKVTIYPEVIAAFESDPSGCSPFTVKLNNQTSGATEYIWDFGDGQGSEEKDPTYTYRNLNVADTAFEIQLIALSPFDCSDTLRELVTVFSRPLASFTVSPGVVQLPDSTVFIVNQSSPGDWKYEWNFGDKETSAEKDPIEHNYDFYGSYKIRLIVSGTSCSDTAFQTVKVLPTKPVVSFSGNSKGCSPVVVQFKNTTKYAENYLWDFGDGESSSLKNPSHTYDVPGTYIVTLRATGEGGMDEVSSNDPIEVFEIPSAFFKVKPVDKVVKIPGNAHYFENLSKGAVTYEWKFGDGTSSIEKNPSHEYREVGVYDVTLIATNEAGCKNEYIETGAAVAEPAGKLKMPNAFTPADGNLSSANKNDYYKPVTEGVSEFQMQIFNRWGELIFETFQLEPGWDGTYRGKPCKQDVYICKFKGKFITGEPFDKVIDVTLIR